MEKIVILAIVAFVAFQGCIARPSSTSQLETLADNAKLLAENVTKTLGLHEVSSEKVLKTINDQAKTLSDNLKALKARVDKEVSHHEGDVKANLQQLEAKLTKSLEDIGKIVDPEQKAKKGADEVRAQFESSFKGAADSFDQWAKSVEPQAKRAGDDVRKFAKSILDAFLEVGKDIQTKVTKAVEDHDKTHTH